MNRETQPSDEDDDDSEALSNGILVLLSPLLTLLHANAIVSHPTTLIIPTCGFLSRLKNDLSILVSRGTETQVGPQGQ